MRYKNKIYYFGSFFQLGVIFLATACSNAKTADQGTTLKNNSFNQTITQEMVIKNQNNWKGQIEVTHDSAWSPVIDKAINLLPDGLKKRVKKIDLKTTSSIDYITNTVQFQAKNAADVFAAPLDRFENLVDLQLALQVGTTQKDQDKWLEEYGDNKQMVQIGDGYYAYPLNVESVITYWNKKVTPTLPEDLEPVLSKSPEESKFVTKFADLWIGSTLFNGLFAKEKGVKDASKQWADGNKPNITAPFINDQESVDIIKKAYTYQSNLRKSNDNTLKTVGEGGAQRDATTRDGLAKGQIGMSLDGPWILNDLVSYVLLANKDAPAQAVETLKNLETKKLPKLNGNQMRHFTGGWGYVLNRQKLANVAASERAARAEFANYFTQLLTSSQLSSDWFSNAGKISAAKNATVDLDLEKLVLTDPTSAASPKPKIDLSKFINQAGFKEAMSQLYNSVITAVKEQSVLNVDQPRWPGNGYWDAWDRLGLSSTTFATSADQFYNDFKANINRILETANK